MPAMRCLRLGATALLAMLCFAVISRAHGQASLSVLPVKQIAPGLYVHQGQHKDFDDADYDGDIANIGFIVGQEAVAVIDTGGSYDVGLALRNAIGKVTALPVRYVINTHVHPDHILGNAAFADSGAKFVGHERLASAMYESQDSYLRNAPVPRAAGVANRIVLPEIAVSRQTTLDLGGRRLTLQSWSPAHTTTDLTVYDEASQTLWAGDLLFVQRTPSLDGEVNGWLAAIDTLKRSPAAHVIPGHGAVPANSKVAWDKVRHYLQVLQGDVRQSIKTGGDIEAAMREAAASEKKNWSLFDVTNRRNVNLLYPKLEWE